MICPHCGKNTTKIYYEGMEIDLKDAKSVLKLKIGTLKELQIEGAYGKEDSSFELNAQYDKIEKEASELYSAIGG